MATQLELPFTRLCEYCKEYHAEVFKFSCSVYVDINGEMQYIYIDICSKCKDKHFSGYNKEYSMGYNTGVRYE